MGVFNKGYKAVEEEKKRQENRRSLFRFFVKGDGSEADIRFLTDNPITFTEHTIKTNRQGKEYYDTVICTGDERPCSHCSNGDRPSFKGAYLIWDNREFEVKDNNGTKKKVKGSLKLYVAGTKVLSQIQRLYSKYGLLDREYTVVRLGEGTSTTYTFERGEKLAPLSKKEIEAMLPENLRKLYDGTQESLDDIVEKVLESEVANSGNASSNSNSSSTDDDEDDDYNTELVGADDEDEVEERPKRTSMKSVLKARKR